MVKHGRHDGHHGNEGRPALMNVVRLRVRYDEGDQMGITYHARYLDWFVIGRTELLRSIGLSYAQLERNGLLLPVLEARCRYFASTRYDDVVQIKTTLTQVRRTRVAFRYEVRLLADETGAETIDETAADGAEFTSEELASAGAERVLVTAGETSHAFVDVRHRPIDVRKQFPRVWDKLAPLADLIGGS